MTQLPTIAGRVPVVRPSYDRPTEYWISDGKGFSLNANGEWDSIGEVAHYLPTEADAREFAIEVAGREGGELRIEGRRAFVQEVEGGMGYIIRDRDSGDCYSPPPYGWASKSSGVWPDYEGARIYAEKCAGKSTPTLAEPGAKVGCGSLEAKIAGLIAANARHRDGTRLAEANWGIVLDHLESELSELRSGIACRDAANVLEELGDILGIVIHAVLKAGFTMAQVEARESAKLDERFTIPRKATP